jgi:two-component system nitrogen regulation sensor histidine kinase GlnL
VTPYSGLELISTAVLMLDEHLQVTYANPAAETLLAHGRKHLVGASLDKALPGNDEFLRRVQQAIHSDGGFNENELVLDLGGEAVHLHCVMTPVESERESSATLGESPPRVALEFRELEQQLKIARESRLIEQQLANRELMRNLAHEIKNPLGGIRGSAQLLERELPDAELREFTQVIVKEADRLQALMNRLLTPNRPANMESVNIHEALERVRLLLIAEFPGRLSIVRDYDTSLPELLGDREQLMQAILNVARNAAQATEGRGEIRFITRVERGVTIARNRYKLAIAVVIEDDGPGVKPEIAERIFYPLVSGRPDGTGLGLALAQGYAGQHEGIIEFDSVPGHTRFTVLLPVRDPAVGSPPGDRITKAPP